MRKVMVSKHVLQDNRTWGLEEVGEALFHQFWVDYEEFESGPGNFSTAIIEWPNGVVEAVPVTRIRFIENKIEIEQPTIEI